VNSEGGGGDHNPPFLARKREGSFWGGGGASREVEKYERSEPGGASSVAFLKEKYEKVAVCGRSREVKETGKEIAATISYALRKQEGQRGGEGREWCISHSGVGKNIA